MPPPSAPFAFFWAYTNLSTFRSNLEVGRPQETERKPLRNSKVSAGRLVNVPQRNKLKHMNAVKPLTVAGSFPWNTVPC